MFKAVGAVVNILFQYIDFFQLKGCPVARVAKRPPGVLLMMGESTLAH